MMPLGVGAQRYEDDVRPPRSTGWWGLLVGAAVALVIVCLGARWALEEATASGSRNSSTTMRDMSIAERNFR